jgi:hypothetical protein
MSVNDVFWITAAGGIGCVRPTIPENVSTAGTLSIR